MNEKEKTKSKADGRLIILDYILALIFIVGILYVYDTRSSFVIKSVGQTPIAFVAQEVAPLSITVARTEAEKALGLGDRASLPADEGMLFVFDMPSAYGFWMKDMSFPIDIISLDSEFSIVHIEAGVSPLTYPEVFSSPENTLYVLETNAGYATENNLHTGDTLNFLKQAVNK